MTNPSTYLTLGQASKLVGKSKPTLSKALSSGRLSYVSKSKSGYQIDPTELQRVYGDTPLETQRTELEIIKEQLVKVEQMHERERVQLNQQIEDLRADKEAWRGQAERLLLEHQQSEKPKSLFARVFNI